MKNSSKSKAKLHKYHVAISFASEDRQVARSFYEEFTKHELNCFFDEKKLGESMGKDGAEYLNQVYREDSLCCVLLVSTSYSQKMWPQLEMLTAINRDDRLFVVCLDAFQHPLLKGKFVLNLDSNWPIGLSAKMICKEVLKEIYQLERWKNNLKPIPDGELACYRDLNFDEIGSLVCEKIYMGSHRNLTFVALSAKTVIQSQQFDAAIEMLADKNLSKLIHLEFYLLNPHTESAASYSSATGIKLEHLERHYEDSLNKLRKLANNKDFNNIDVKLFLYGRMPRFTLARIGDELYFRPFKPTSRRIIKTNIYYARYSESNNLAAMLDNLILDLRFDSEMSEINLQEQP